MSKQTNIFLTTSLLLGATLLASRTVGQSILSSNEIPQVENLVATADGAKKVVLTWDAVAEADKYKVRLMNEAGETLRTKTTDDTKKKLKKLESDTTYQLKVRAVVGDEKGPWSDTLEYTTATATTTIAISDFIFNPDNVEINAGESVTWVNDDSSSHTVTSDDEAFDSGTIAPGETFALDFPTAGSFPYHCDFHTSMKGTVIVK